MNFEYTAIVERVIDGDTIISMFDLGFSIYSRQALRLKGINAPELVGDESIKGRVSRDWLKERIEGKTVTIKTFKDGKDKYGRYLANIFIEGFCINDEMLILGYAAKY